MKRRNADCGKLRRPMKRNKITESMYGSTTVLYMKFLVLWAIVITADFMFMFRFEFLWPFWLLLRSVHDSFKYKGLAFSVLFVCIAITSDLVCLFFIPVHWLLFAASTFVWVQYLWHTDKGICIPTIILWMLFVYLEAGIRWKDSRHMPHLDLCRPFAAHCIGYPVVTLGFGFKSYVDYCRRQRKQREVAKENEFYMQLLQQALPQEEALDEAHATANGAIGNIVITTTAETAVTTTGGGPTAIAPHPTQSIQNNSITSTSIAAVSSMLGTSNQNSNGNLSSNLNSNQNTNTNITLSVSSAAAAALAATTANVSIMANGILTSQAQIHQNPNHNQTNEQHIQQINTTGSNNITISGTNLVGVSGSASVSNSDDKNYVQISSGGGGSVTSNGHIGGHSSHTKGHKRSVDKESKSKGHNSNSSSINNSNRNASDDSKHNKSNNIGYQQLQVDANPNNNNNSCKEKVDWDNCQIHQNMSSNAKDKQEDHRSNATNFTTSKKLNSHNNYGANTPMANGNVMQFDNEDITVIPAEPVERTKGRRNRTRKDAVAKDNQHQNNSNSTSNNMNSNSSNTNHLNHNNHHTSKESSVNNLNHINSDASSVSSTTSTSTSTSTCTSTSNSSISITNLATKVVTKICESCLKLEADVKKYRSEISHMKQIENELRQKLESNLTTKSCLQVKQKECDELDKRINDLNNARHADMLQLQTAERRLTEERRQKQSLEAQLNNEKKARKMAEDKASRPECSSQCKQRKQQVEEEVKQLRRDLKLAEEGKQMAEQHGRKWEQELRMFEAEIRNRDSNQPGTEMLMNALAAMQDKNCTLEKNLSAETRVKLDLFSALGDAKRQLEISESRRRSKEDEVLDLKAKIAQLLAVMPTDALCMQACSSTAAANSILRMNETPPLQSGPGPASPMLSSLGGQSQNPPVPHPMSARVTSTGDYVQQSPSDYVNSQQQQQQCAGVVPVSVTAAVLVAVSSSGAGGSGLDPNASIYTPKGPGGPGGVIVGGAGDA